MQFESVYNHALAALFHNRMIAVDMRLDFPRLASDRSFWRCLLPQFALPHPMNADILSAAVLALQ